MLARMIDLDSDKWLAIRIACENMAGIIADPALNATYAWLILAAEHNAHSALAADNIDREAAKIVAQEPNPTV
jgi:hypothetical protein